MQAAGRQVEDVLISRRTATRAVAAIFVASMVMAPAAAVHEPPDAAIELEGGSFGVGVGMEWASGTLRYQGRTIPIEVSGLSLAKIGAANFEAKGHVYHLRQLSDFSGRYAAMSAGAGLLRGRGAIAMRNEKGVVIRMTASTGGIDLDLGVKAVSFSFQ